MTLPIIEVRQIYSPRPVLSNAPESAPRASCFDISFFLAFDFQLASSRFSRPTALSPLPDTFCRQMLPTAYLARG